MRDRRTTAGAIVASEGARILPPIGGNDLCFDVAHGVGPGVALKRDRGVDDRGTRMILEFGRATPPNLSN